ncbi:MAG TPA: protein kinase, partial [Burkholderiaceae bacterium]
MAIKLLHLSLIGRAAAQRFSQEGALLARLSHPNIARLLDAGVTESGQPYLVLELVEGERIDVWCERRALGIEQRLALFDEVLAAVAHAHSHLIIHRDIKPNNILVDADGHVKLLDFGISRLVDDESREATVTVLGQRAMTPEFAAPEQVAGEMITTATDVYALGVLLYLLLGGRHPTVREGAARAEAARAALDTEPLPLSASMRAAGATSPAALAAARGTSEARLRRQLAGDLEKIVAHALRKRPHERYQTVAALADDLRRHREHEPVLAREDGVVYRFGKFVRRNRNGVTAAVLIGIATVAGVAGTVTQARHAEVLAGQARQERDNALRQLAYAESSAEFIGFLLQQGSDKPFTTTELLERGEQLVARQFADDPAQSARLRLMLSEQYGQAMRQKNALAVLMLARSDAQRSSDPLLQVAVDCEIASQEGDDGDFSRSRTLFDASIARLRDSHLADQALLARCLHGRAELANAKGDLKAALADAQAALDTLGTPRSDQRSEAILMRATLAMVQGRLGQAASAEATFRRTLADLESMGRGHTYMASTLYNNLAVILADAGQVSNAAQAFQRALEIEGGAVVESNYAKVLVLLGRFGDAKPLFEHALSASGTLVDKSVAPAIALHGATAWCQTHETARCDELLATARAGLTRTKPAGAPIFATLEMRFGE